MPEIIINNVKTTVPDGITVLEAAKRAGFEIPTLCYLKGINEIGACRVCMVELKPAGRLVTACNTLVSEGMDISTNSPKVLESRKSTLELILSDHDRKCTSCVRSSGGCELQALANEYGCEYESYNGERNVFPIDDSTEFLVRDNNKCILCRRCEAMCRKIQNVGVIGAQKRGFATEISCAFTDPLSKTSCVACGQCITVCPTGALREKDDTGLVYRALNDKSKVVVAVTAPAVRVAVGEEFGMAYGTDSEGKMISALKALGFSKVFDVNTAADLTIMEEGYEFLGRLQNGGTLPIITSCSPGWIRYIEFNYPELLAHLSTCKSPQQMFGAVLKTYYADKTGVKPENIFVVSVMPCVAKKFERTRDHQSASGYPDIDAVITTRELARMIRSSGIIYNSLGNSQFDDPLGEASSAGLLFGATGGVMEAALRTLSEVITGKTLEKLDFKKVRGEKGLKTAEYDLNGTKVKVAVVNGVGGAKKVLEEIKAGKSPYHFIEIMTCPGGCVGGGGQPVVPAKVRNFTDVPSLRAKAIYKRDSGAAMRKSHENPAVKAFYAEYFGKPNSEKAHHILHTKYTSRKK